MIGFLKSYLSLGKIGSHSVARLAIGNVTRVLIGFPLLSMLTTHLIHFLASTAKCKGQICVMIITK